MGHSWNWMLGVFVGSARFRQPDSLLFSANLPFLGSLVSGLIFICVVAEAGPIDPQHGWGTEVDEEMSPP